MRKAFDKVKDTYINNEIASDIMETLLVTSVLAGMQGIQGLSLEEIALAAALGSGSGFAGRPLGGKVGKAIGRVVDKRYKDTGKNIRKNYEQYRNFSKNLSIRPDAMLDARWNINTSGLGPAEGVFNNLGKMYGDNILQAAVTLGIAPSVIEGIDGERPLD
tara:strand:+ start:367 stop:849 length:483 start_codon:yes stop_codon:yes gene_type:complete